MLVATQLNFLHRQVRVALDRTAPRRDRGWAEVEIDEGLRVLATPDLPTVVLGALAKHPRPSG
jgi:hypothetical protein